MLLANFNRKEHLRHRAVSLRQHGFLVIVSLTFVLLRNLLSLSRPIQCVNILAFWLALLLINEYATCLILVSQRCNEHRGRHISPLCEWLLSLQLQLPQERLCQWQWFIIISIIVLAPETAQSIIFHWFRIILTFQRQGGSGEETLRGEESFYRFSSWSRCHAATVKLMMSFLRERCWQAGVSTLRATAAGTNELTRRASQLSRQCSRVSPTSATAAELRRLDHLRRRRTHERQAALQQNNDKQITPSRNLLATNIIAVLHFTLTSSQ